MKKSDMYPTPVVQKGEYLESGVYFLKMVDPQEKEKHHFKSYTGEQMHLFISTDHISNQILTNPTTGQIVSKAGDTDFEVGDTVIVEQNVFLDRSEITNPKWNTIYTMPDGTELFRVLNYDVFFKVDPVTEKITPRRGALLCESVYDHSVKLIGGGEHEDTKYPRRDMVRVVETWEGDDTYKPGDLLLIEEGGDWRVRFKDRDLIKVDTYTNDVLAKVESESWFNLKVDHTIYR